MTVGAVGSTTSLTSALQAKGLSSDKAQLVEQEVAQTVTASIDLDGTVDGAEVRAKLDKQLADDVKSGKLTKEDAAAVGKLLDDADEIDVAVNGDVDLTTDADTADAAAPAAGGPQGAGGGGGGGGGSTEKTELSRTVEIVASVKTTTIQYTDGTSDVTTAFTTEQSAKEKAAAADKADNGGNSTARQWLANIEPGSLVNKLA